MCSEECFLDGALLFLMLISSSSGVNTSDPIKSVLEHLELGNSNSPRNNYNTCCNTFQLKLICLLLDRLLLAFLFSLNISHASLSSSRDSSPANALNMSSSMSRKKTNTMCITYINHINIKII